MAFPRLSPIPVTWDIVTPQNGTNITADTTQIVWKAPRACEVIDAGFAWHETAITASKTNYAAIYIYNAGAAGTGTSAIATYNNYNTAIAAGGLVSPTLVTTYAALDADDYVSVKLDIQETLAIGRIHGQFNVVYGDSK